ncbi:MAG TPA: NADH-quinone oxidoreductase subunit M [Trueperaceae bacterium]|nr:NADH-quinone oxidoreductase subunit M [Trueperaceae bacterium]
MIAAAVLVLPLLGAVLSAFARSQRAVVRVALLSTMTTFAAALFLPGAATVDLPWLPGLGVTFSLDPNGAAAVLVVVAALVMIPTALIAGLRVAPRSGGFVALLLVAQAGLNGIFMARDLIVFYLFWEATLIPSLILLGAFGLERRSAAVAKYLVYAIGGSFLMLVSILALKSLSGAASFHLTDLMVAAPQLAVGTQTWLFAGLAIGMAVKLPIWPLHSWLIDLNEQNHPSGAADVLGTLYKVGGFGFFAWALPILPAGAERLAPLLLALGAFTAVYGAVIATSQDNLKRLLAYASLSHMGIVAVGLFGLHIAGLNGAIYLLAAQMLSTGGLFLVSGMLYARRRSFDVGAYGGLAKSAPALGALTLFLIFAFIGVPGLGNFPGEFLSLLGAFQTAPWLAALATLTVIAAGVFGVNLYQRLFQGPPTATLRDIDSLEAYVLVPFVAGILWLGFAPAPQLEQIETQSELVVLQQEALQRQSLAPDSLAPESLAADGGER